MKQHLTLAAHNWCSGELNSLADAIHSLGQLKSPYLPPDTQHQALSFLAESSRLLIENAIFLLQISHMDKVEAQRVPHAFMSSFTAYSRSIVQFHESLRHSYCEYSLVDFPREDFKKVKERAALMSTTGFDAMGEDSLDIISRFCSAKDSLSVLVVSKRFNRVFGRRVLQDVYVCIGPDAESSYLKISEDTKNLLLRDVTPQLCARMKFTEKIDVYLQNPPENSHCDLLDSFQLHNLKVCNIDMWHEFEGDFPEFEEFLKWMAQFFSRNSEFIESLKLTFWDDDFVVFSQAPIVSSMLLSLRALKELSLVLHLYDHTPPMASVVSNAMHQFINGIPRKVSIQLHLDGHYVATDIPVLDCSLLDTERITCLNVHGVNITNMYAPVKFSRCKQLSLENMLIEKPWSLPDLMAVDFVSNLEELFLTISSNWWLVGPRQVSKFTKPMPKLKLLSIKVKESDVGKDWIKLVEEVFELAPNLKCLCIQLQTNLWGEKMFLEKILKMRPLAHLSELNVRVATSEQYAESDVAIQSLISKLQNRFPSLFSVHLDSNVSRYWSSLCLDLRAAQFQKRVSNALGKYVPNKSNGSVVQGEQPKREASLSPRPSASKRQKV